MTEWMCMDPDHPDLICDYEACEIRCPYREVREKWDEAVEHAHSTLDAEGGDEPPCVDIRDWVNALRRNLTIYAEKLEAVNTHIEDRLDFLKDATDYECETLKIELEEVLKVQGPIV